MEDELRVGLMHVTGPKAKNEKSRHIAVAARQSQARRKLIRQAIHKPNAGTKKAQKIMQNVAA